MLIARLLTKDTACFQEQQLVNPIGYIQAGTEVHIFQTQGEVSQVYSPRHEQLCWLKNRGFAAVSYLHPDDLANTMRWQTLVERFLPEFEDALTTELVLAVIAKETRGDPHAVDASGQDIKLLGQASVGVGGTVPRPHLPCYETLVGPNGKDEYPCQVYLTMYVLDAAIELAHQLNTGAPAPLSSFSGTILIDTECRKHAVGGDVIGWMLAGSRFQGSGYVRGNDGQPSAVHIYSDRHEDYCWVDIEAVKLDGELAHATPAPTEYTHEDIVLGLRLFNCSVESVLNDACITYGDTPYAQDIIENILPVIVENLQ